MEYFKTKKFPERRKRKGFIYIDQPPTKDFDPNFNLAVSPKKRTKNFIYIKKSPIKDFDPNFNLVISNEE